MTIHTNSTAETMLSDPHHHIEPLDMINATSKLQLEAAEVRNNKPNWISYLRSQLVPQDEYSFITAYEGAKTKAERDEVLNRDRTQTAKCLIGLITDVARDQLIRYVLTVLDDLLQEDRNRAEIFHEYARKTKQSVWARFQGILTRNDNYIVNQVSSMEGEEELIGLGKLFF